MPDLAAVLVPNAPPPGAGLSKPPISGMPAGSPDGRTGDFADHLALATGQGPATAPLAALPAASAPPSALSPMAMCRSEPLPAEATQPPTVPSSAIDNVADTPFWPMPRPATGIEITADNPALDSGEAADAAGDDEDRPVDGSADGMLALDGLTPVIDPAIPPPPDPALGSIAAMANAPNLTSRPTGSLAAEANPDPVIGSATGSQPIRPDAPTFRHPTAPMTVAPDAQQPMVADPSQLASGAGSARAASAPAGPPPEPGIRTPAPDMGRTDARDAVTGELRGSDLGGGGLDGFDPDGVNADAPRPTRHAAGAPPSTSQGMTGQGMTGQGMAGRPDHEISPATTPDARPESRAGDTSERRNAVAAGRDAIEMAQTQTDPTPQAMTTTATTDGPDRMATDPASAALRTAAPAADQIATRVAPVLIRLDPAASGGQRLTIRLDPEELGQVEVRIERPEPLTARVHILVERPETLALLRRDQAALERALDDAGVGTRGRDVVLDLADPIPAATVHATADPRQDPSTRQDSPRPGTEAFATLADQQGDRRPSQGGAGQWDDGRERASNSGSAALDRARGDMPASHAGLAPGERGDWRRHGLNITA